MKPSKIDQMPRVARELIERELLAANFCGYVEIARKLKGLGKGVSKSGLHRHAQKMQDLQQRAKFEAEVMAQMGDEAAYLLAWARREPRAAQRLVQRLRKQEEQQQERSTT